MITIKKSFQWSPNGYDVKTIDAGEHETLPDRAVEIASQLGLLEKPAQKKAASKKKAQDKNE